MGQFVYSEIPVLINVGDRTHQGANDGLCVVLQDKTVEGSFFSVWEVTHLEEIDLQSSIG